ncbi:conserved Plasmodium protein, unknown function [Plasmodium ovale wallikeri]|uniref:Uncharacterized protein n=1 Tax=Plasmodium ovale wallikeri TaxID=864142 RepID=A0A1A9AIB4_PLAOA|nr:conserved Plasmodium protein, unknown function [Plasmodium ovale wallikeri]SBT59045.1 conserved Plasmodium protein, unknown function [Plasmodium ovale wallikeri]
MYTNVVTTTSSSSPLLSALSILSPVVGNNESSTLSSNNILGNIVNNFAGLLTDTLTNVTSPNSGNTPSQTNYNNYNPSAWDSNIYNSTSIYDSTNNSGHFPLGGKNFIFDTFLNVLILLLPFLSLLIVIPIALFLYDKTPIGNCYNKVYDNICCDSPTDEIQYEDDQVCKNEDIEKGKKKNTFIYTSSGGKTNCKQKKTTKRKNSFSTQYNTPQRKIPQNENKITQMFKFVLKPSLSTELKKTLLESENENGDNNNSNTRTRTSEKKTTVIFKKQVEEIHIKRYSEMGKIVMQEVENALDTLHT